MPKSDKVDATFLWLALRSRYARIQFLAATGGAMKGEISEEALLRIKVPLPSLQQQHAIVQRWAESQRQARSAEERAENVKQAVANHFFESLGLRRTEDSTSSASFAVPWDGLERWSVSYNQAARRAIQFESGRYPVLALGSFVTLVQYGTSQKPNASGRGVPILRMNNIVYGILDTSNLKHVELSDAERSRLVLRDGDILFNRTNSKELVGKCAVFHEQGDFVFASYLIRVRTTPEVDPDYVAFVLNSAVGRSQIDALSRQIIGQANVNTAELRSLRIPLPPFDVQCAIVERVAEARKAIIRERDDAARTVKIAEVQVEEMILGKAPPSELVAAESDSGGHPVESNTYTEPFPSKLSPRNPSLR